MKYPAGCGISVPNVPAIPMGKQPPTAAVLRITFPLARAIHPEWHPILLLK